jgi:hypothetical protein
LFSGFGEIIAVLVSKQDFLVLLHGFFGFPQAGAVEFPQGKMRIVGQDVLPVEFNDFKLA